MNESNCYRLRSVVICDAVKSEGSALICRFTVLLSCCIFCIIRDHFADGVCDRTIINICQCVIDLIECDRSVCCVSLGLKFSSGCILEHEAELVCCQSLSCKGLLCCQYDIALCLIVVSGIIEITNLIDIFFSSSSISDNSPLVITFNGLIIYRYHKIDVTILLRSSCVMSLNFYAYRFSVIFYAISFFFSDFLN